MLRDRAREMRKSPTDAERVLWRLLRAKRLSGWKFRRQQRLDPYIVDFISFEARLIVEADGSQHLDSQSDARRDTWLASQGFRLLRFWNNEILTNSDGVQTAILAALAATPHPNPPPQGGREQKDCSVA